MAACLAQPLYLCIRLLWHNNVKVSTKDWRSEVFTGIRGIILSNLSCIMHCKVTSGDGKHGFAVYTGAR